MPKPLRLLSLLHRATRQIGIHFEAQLADLPAQGTECHLLSYLASYAPAACGELGRVFGMKPSTLTSTLDRLEDRGLLVREVDAEDRRSFLVTLTHEGERAARTIDRFVRGFERRVLARLKPRDLAGFEAVVAAISDETDVIVRTPKEKR